MPEHGYDLRPDIEDFEHAGCRVAIVEAAGILAAAEAGPVELLSGATFPDPVRRVTLRVAGAVRGAEPVHRFTARIATGGVASSEDELSSAVLGMTGPVGVLLARRVAAGDKLAKQIADGVGQAAARLGLGRPATEESAAGTVDADVIREEVESAGLRASVTRTEVPAGRTVTIEAAVPSATVGPAHLRAVCELVLDEVAALVPESGALAGRRYVISRQPANRRADPDGIEHVDLDQVGGLPAVVAQFRQIAVSFRHPGAMARWGARRPQGILMYGPPGTGKTMLARALANEIGARFREIRTPEILDKWLGGSERNIKQIFQEARRYREPTVMLFDEFDSIISYVGDGMDAASHAVNAVAGIFKQEMNGLIEANPNVIVVATTNFPQRVDESLIRSGRFDVKISIPVPGEAGRAEIFAKMIRQLIVRHEVPGFRMFADDVDPAGLAQASPGMTGADIKEVLRRVQLAKALQEARGGTVPPPINQDELVASIDALRRGAAA